jgi:hypothetical protein
VLVLGHGRGKSNAAKRFAEWARAHDAALAAKLVGEIACDVDDLTDDQIVGFARQYFRVDPQRRGVGA